MNKIPFSKLINCDDLGTFLTLNMPVKTAIDFVDFYSLDNTLCIFDEDSNLIENVSKDDISKNIYLYLLDEKYTTINDMLSISVDMELYQLLGQRYKKTFGIPKDKDMSFSDFKSKVIENSTKFEREILMYANSNSFNLFNLFRRYVFKPFKKILNTKHLSPSIAKAFYIISKEGSLLKNSPQNYITKNGETISSTVASYLMCLGIVKKIEDNYGNKKIVLDEDVRLIDDTSFECVIKPYLLPQSLKDAFFLLFIYKKLLLVQRGDHSNSPKKHVLPDLEDIKVCKDFYSLNGEMFFNYTDSYLMNKLVNLGLATKDNEFYIFND